MCSSASAFASSIYVLNNLQTFRRDLQKIQHVIEHIIHYTCFETPDRNNYRASIKSKRKNRALPPPVGIIRLRGRRPKAQTDRSSRSSLIGSHIHVITERVRQQSKLHRNMKALRLETSFFYDQKVIRSACKDRNLNGSMSGTLLFLG